VALVFDAEQHTYTLDGVVLPSVTGVLKASGLIDFSSIPPRYLEAALERGRIVHQALHYYNENDLDVGEFVGNYPQYAGYLQAWIAFKEQRRFRPMLCERRLVSRRHGVAGTLDCLGEMDGHGALVDFKTGNPEDVAADLQTAAYEAFAREWAKEDAALAAFFASHKVVRRFSVRLKRDGAFSVSPYSNPGDYSEFLALVAARRIVERRMGEAAAWQQEAA
jgi:hypothetical protein